MSLCPCWENHSDADIARYETDEPLDCRCECHAQDGEIASLRAEVARLTREIAAKDAELLDALLANAAHEVAEEQGDAALKSSRAAAMEEAAGIADASADRVNDEPDAIATAFQIAAAIRAAKERK